jgi:hypothetical protein
LRMQSLPSVSTLTAIWVLMNFTASFFANWNLSVNVVVFICYGFGAR